MGKVSSSTFNCRHCGTPVPAGAKACPECGADENTAWSDQTIYDGTGIEDPAEFDYEEWQRREGFGGAARSGKRLSWVWLVALLLLVLMVFLLLR